MFKNRVVVCLDHGDVSSDACNDLGRVVVRNGASFRRFSNNNKLEAIAHASNRVKQHIPVVIYIHENTCAPDEFSIIEEICNLTPLISVHYLLSPYTMEMMDTHFSTLHPPAAHPPAHASGLLSKHRITLQLYNYV
eukprot:TRINITY_DN28361_c0_g1_i1.p1 TRINITY_DN28361_c0_g1~~TRINITY_DN28361_c0_g1_i1.p1  ORF type:complete len:136 (+),score=17.52 TRINITY_DN28361_c0_g1_i1:297-704(+)